MHQIYSPTPIHTLPHTATHFHALPHTSALIHLIVPLSKTYPYISTHFCKVRFCPLFSNTILHFLHLFLQSIVYHPLSLLVYPFLHLPSSLRHLTSSLSHTHTHTQSPATSSLSLALWHPLSPHTCGDNASPEINPLASIWCQVDLYLIPSHRRTWLILLTSVAIDGVVVVAVFDVAVVIKRDRRDIVPIDAIKAAFAAANQTLNRS